MTIIPDGPYKPGDELTCIADGYNPTYTWTGVFNGIPIDPPHSGSSYTLVEGDFQVICTPTVDELTCPDVVTAKEDSALGCPVGKY